MNALPRIRNVTAPEFARDYMAKNRPVIVADAMRDWAALGKWTPAFFRDEFGDLDTMVYDELFALKDVVPLRRYIDQNFGKDGQGTADSYVRWYEKFKEIDFFWSDSVFASLRNDWNHPAFLPNTGYVLPLCRQGRALSANHDRFPYKGLFISPQGGRTRLHRDPFGTDAVLCQIHGSKRVALYRPDQKDFIEYRGEFVDLSRPDAQKFPDHSRARTAFEDRLEPGEILFLPAGWYHDVVSVTDSISITWNFVHSTGCPRFLHELACIDGTTDRSMLDFFFGTESVPHPTTEHITRMAGEVLQESP